MKTSNFVKIGTTLFVKKSKSGNVILQRKQFGNPRFTLKPKEVGALMLFVGAKKSEAVYHMGTIRNRKLIPMLDEILRESIKNKDHSTLYQTIIALDNLDALHSVTKEDQTFCSLNLGSNMKLAKKYLNSKKS